jgi:hypothetical protein
MGLELAGKIHYVTLHRDNRNCQYITLDRYIFQLSNDYLSVTGICGGCELSPQQWSARMFGEYSPLQSEKADFFLKVQQYHRLNLPLSPQRHSEIFKPEHNRKQLCAEYYTVMKKEDPKADKYCLYF